MDELREYLLSAVLDRVNNVNAHNIDKDKLMGQVENLVTGIGGIEDLAMDVEKGEYEAEPYEPNHSMSMVCK